MDKYVPDDNLHREQENSAKSYIDELHTSDDRKTISKHQPKINVTTTNLTCSHLIHINVCNKLSH